MLEERLLGLVSQPFDVVERRPESLLLAEAHARAVREAVRLVAQPGEKEQRRGGALQRDWILLAGQVDAVDEEIARQVLALLGQRDHGQIVETQVVRRGEGHRKQTATT